MSNKIQHYTVYFIWKLLYMFWVVSSSIIRSANNCIYSIWYLSHRYCYLPLSRKSRNWFEYAVGGVPTTSSNSSTIAEDSSNGVTNTKCCRYSCLRSWWWWWYHLKHVEQFQDKINCVNLYLVRYIVEYYYDARTHER